MLRKPYVLKIQITTQEADAGGPSLRQEDYKFELSPFLKRKKK